MPKQDKLLSESEFEGESLEDAIKASFRDISSGLCNVEKSLLDLIDMDIISIERFGSCFELSHELIILTKELHEILKSFKPAGFGKARKEMQKTQDENIEAFKRSGMV
jgi:hypothetical protein